jgi:hypothetical protein
MQVFGSDAEDVKRAENPLGVLGCFMIIFTLVTHEPVEKRVSFSATGILPHFIKQSTKLINLTSETP